MKKHFTTRLLSILLAVALIAGFAVPASAASGVQWEKVDNSAVSANLPNQAAETGTEAPSTYKDTDMVRVSIVLEDKSTVEAGYSTNGIAQSGAAMTYRGDLQAKQEDMAQKISKQVLGGRTLDVVWNMTLVANIISANVPYGKLDAIRALDGVKRVVVETQYLPTEDVQSGNVAEPQMNTSANMIGSNIAWAEGYTGAGSRIAVIDTGLDEDHPSFNGGALEFALAEDAKLAGMDYEKYVEQLNLLDAEEISSVLPKLNAAKRAEGLTADQLYRNTKVAYGFNYVDNDLDITHDNDAQGDHGTHVSGISTSNRYLEASAGAYESAAEKVFVNGVAPDAQLLTMKVFGRAGGAYDSDYMVAIEDAILLGCDAVNLSLGSPYAGETYNDVYAALLDSLTETDTVLTISAGNNSYWASSAMSGGNLYADGVNFDTVGSPGSYTNALTVASVENIGSTGPYLQVGERKFFYGERTGEYTNAPMASLDKSEDGNGTKYEYVAVDALGAEADYAGLDLEGKIAICTRGDLSFSEKANNAMKLGAAAVIIINNQATAINMDLSDYRYTAPVVMMSMDQGATFKGISEKHETEDGRTYYTGSMLVSATVGSGLYDPTGYYTMSDFSSWGTPGALTIKPEITAPGGNIYSTLNNGTYGLNSGTSMAAPQMAGVAALVAQYIRENGLAEKTGLKVRTLSHSLIMSTAEPMLEEASGGNYYSVLNQGAGLANVPNAMSAESYVLVKGQDDGKVKAELGDDPDRTGSYQFSFSLNNLTDKPLDYNLYADLFTQDLFTDGGVDYLDTWTTALNGNTTFLVDGKNVTNQADQGKYDMNGDGQVDEADAQCLLDYLVDNRVTIYADPDVNGDGQANTYDGHCLLALLGGTGFVTVPAGGTVEVEVTITLPKSVRNYLDENYPVGAYVEGFVYAEPVATAEGVKGVTHSIPLLGYYGSWTESSMFDVGSYAEFNAGLEDRVPYVPGNDGGPNANINFLTIKYAGEDGEYFFAGNPAAEDETYLPQRNALNNLNGDKLSKLVYSLIRNAGAARFQVTDAETGEVYAENDLGAVLSAFFHDKQQVWQYLSRQLSLNWAGTDAKGNKLPEGTTVNLSLVAAPEYYRNEDGTYDWDALGEGAYLTNPVTIDNTAPEINDISFSVAENRTMTVNAKDNQYVSAVMVYNAAGTTLLQRVSPNQTEAGVPVEVKLDLTKAGGSKFLVAVFDYAMNQTTYQVSLGSAGGDTETYDFKAFDHKSNSWIGFNAGTTAEQVTQLAASNLTFFSATYVDGYVFAITDTGDLYVMEDSDLSSPTYVVSLGGAITDLAYNPADGLLYGVYNGALVSIDKLMGTPEVIGTVAIPNGTVNTVACDDEGNFYSIDVATGNLYTYTKDTVANPTKVGSTGYSMRYVQSLAWNPNDGYLYWTQFYSDGTNYQSNLLKIDSKTAATVDIGDLPFEATCLYMTEKEDGGKWYEPTDEIGSMMISNETLSLLVDNSGKLSVAVLPWTVSDKTVTWSSSDEGVATVNADGVVTGVAKGEATITAKANVDPTKTVTCKVTVDTVDVTVEGVLQDKDGNPMRFSWDLGKDKTWTGGTALDTSIGSATYDTKHDVLWVQDGNDDTWAMHKVDPKTGKSLETSGASGTGTPLWDMAYSEYLGGDASKVASVYGIYLLAPKDPMNLDTSAFNWSQFLAQEGATRLVTVASGGYQEYEDEDTGSKRDTECFYMLDDAGNIWVLWMYAEGDSYSCNLNSFPSNLKGEFPLNGNYQFCSMWEDHETGILFLSYFTGTTNELYMLGFNGESFEAIALGDVGEEVWPAVVTGAKFNEAPANFVSAGEAFAGAEQATAEQISVEELQKTVENSAAAPAGSLNAVTATTQPKAHPVGETKGVSFDPAKKTVTVVIEAAEAATNGRLELAYDANAMTLVDVASNVQVYSANVKKDSLIFAYAAQNPVAKDAALATLTFNLSDNAAGVALVQALTTERNESVDLEEADLFYTLLYKDVPVSHWAYDYIALATMAGLMNGTAKNVFAPESKLTRGQMVTVLYRLAGEPEGQYANPFTDVADGRFYSEPVKWAASVGITDGVDKGLFKPNASMTREQMVTFFFRFAEMNGMDVSKRADLSGYTDASSISNYAVDAFEWAVAVGLVDGTSKTALSPKHTSTRAQVATVLVRFLLADGTEGE